MAVLRINGESVQLDAGKLTNREAMAIEEALNIPIGEVIGLAERGSMRAMTALVWMLQRRSKPDLKFEDVEFALDDIKLDESPDPTSAGNGSSKTTSKRTGSRR